MYHGWLLRRLCLTRKYSNLVILQNSATFDLCEKKYHFQHHLACNVKYVTRGKYLFDSLLPIYG